MIPGSWQQVSIVAGVVLVLAGFASLLIKRPDRRPRIRVGRDARHGCAPQPDERDSLALFRRIMCDQRTRLGI